MAMSFWDLLQAYIDDTGATEASVLRRADLGKGTFTAWRNRGIPQLPSRAQLFALAGALRVDYETVLMAILHDIKYLPEATAREEQDRVDAIAVETQRRYTAQVRRHVAHLLQDSDNDVAAARHLNRELYVDGSISPVLSEAADLVLDTLGVDPAFCRGHGRL